MLIETRELTLCNVDLGTLDEFSAMTLFGDAYLRHLSAGTGVPPTSIEDAAGNVLYPGFFWSHLTVPPSRSLERHMLWDKVSVGADVVSFGGMVLDSTYLLGRPGEVPDDRSLWNLESLPSMRGGSMFMVEDSRGVEPSPAVPKEGMVAPLAKIQKPPAAILEFNRVQKQGCVVSSFDATIQSKQPIEYRLAAYRDVYPGHAVMFATLARIVGSMERTLLLEQTFPPFPSALADKLTLLEREMFYLSNCYKPGTLCGTIRASLSACSPTLHGDGDDLASCGLLTFIAEVYEKQSGKLIIASRARKLLLVPAWQKTSLRDAERMIAAYGRADADTQAKG